MKNFSEIKIAIIGAGPSGMSQMIAFHQLYQKNQIIPQIKCFEKQEQVGGMWNYDWRTNFDQYGETVNANMYYQLNINAPKECYEFPDYNYLEHFGGPTSSYPPRESMLKYILARFQKYKECLQWIQFGASVKRVEYDQQKKVFLLRWKDLKQNHEEWEVFDYVVVGSGHFSTPYMPSFPGLDTFPGRILHSHECRHLGQFKGQRVLVVGSSYSAEDIVSMCWLNNSKSIIMAQRNQWVQYKWPSNIQVKKNLASVQANRVFFIDGSSAEVDTIILCTGYIHDTPFMEDSLRLHNS